MIRLALDMPSVEASAPPNEQLRYYRELRSLSLGELGSMVGKPAGEIKNFEKKFNPICYEDAEVLSKALDIDINLLLDDYARFTMKGYGCKIKEIREDLKMTQEQFAKLLGTVRSTVSIWEIEYHRPSKRAYEKLIDIQKGIENDTGRKESVVN